MRDFDTFSLHIKGFGQPYIHPQSVAHPIAHVGPVCMCQPTIETLGRIRPALVVTCTWLLVGHYGVVYGCSGGRSGMQIQRGGGIH